MENVSDNKAKKSIKGTFFGTIYKLVTIICPFIVRTIIIYTLGREYVGLSGLFVSILQILSLTELGLGSAMIFNLYKPVNEGDYKTIAKLMNFYKFMYRIIGLIILIIGLIILPFLKSLINGDIPENINIYLLFIIYLSNTCVSYLFFAYRSSLLNAYQRSDLVSNAGTISSILLYVSQIIGLLVFKNYYVYVIFIPISTLVNNLLIYLFSKKQYSLLKEYEKEKLGKDNIKSLFSNVGALFGHKFGAVLIGSFDNIVISAMLGLVPLAIFNNYYYIITAVNAFIDVFMVSVLYGVGNYLLNHTKEENYKLFLKLHFIQTFIVGFCSICLLCLYQDFMLLWVKQENMYHEFHIIILFVLYFYSWKFRIIGLVFKDASGMWKNDFWKPYVGLVFNIIMDIILVYLLGSYGALISTIIIFFFIYFPWETHVLFKDLFSLKPYYYVLKTILYFALNCFACCIVYFITKYIIVDSIMMFLVKALSVAALSLLVMIGLFFWDNGFKYMLDRFKLIFKRNNQ